MELPDNIAFLKKIGRSQPFSGPEFEMRIGHNIPKILGKHLISQQLIKVPNYFAIIRRWDPRTQKCKFSPIFHGN